MKNVLVVLTADHGIPPNPTWLKANRVNAGYVNDSEVNKRLETGLVEKWGKPKDGSWLSFAVDFNYYLNPKSLAARALTPELAQKELKALLDQEEWVALSFSASDVETRQLPGGKWEKQILAGYLPGKSGHVVAIPKPYFIPTDDTVHHLSGYSYDSSVPLIIAGPNVKAGTHAGGEVIDIAPTLSFLLGVVPPAMSEGRVLSEIF